MTDLFGQQATLKALSIWQPFASLIACGVKRHETRHWQTSYRGRIAIHAAKTMDLAGAPARLCHDAMGPAWFSAAPTGAVIAIARLTACLKTEAVAVELTRADLESRLLPPVDHQTACALAGWA